MHRKDGNNTNKLQMLPSRIPTNVSWNESAQRLELDEASMFAYEFPNGKRVPFDLKREEKRMKFSFQNDDNEEGGGEEDDTESVISTTSRSTSHSMSEETELSIKRKLQACMYELGQLFEVLQAKELGSIRIERAPQSLFEKEQSLAVAQSKRQLAFSRAGEMFSSRVALIEQDVHVGKREYFKHLQVLAQKFKIIAPGHGTQALLSIKPDEALAIEVAPINLDSDALLVHIGRSKDGSGLALSLDEDFSETLQDFKAQALEVELFVKRESKGKGSAKTRGFHRCSTEHETTMESVIRDFYAREMFNSLGDKNIRLQLDANTHLEFKLAAESKQAELLSLNKFDGICSLALNLLQRGKSAEQIQLCCTHLLQFSMLDYAYGKLAWQHSEDESDCPELVQTRCQVDFGMSGRYAAEFCSVHGKQQQYHQQQRMVLDWHTFEDFFLEEGDMREVIARAQVKAICMEMIAVVNAVPKFKAEKHTETTLQVLFQQEVVAKLQVYCKPQQHAVVLLEPQHVTCEIEEMGGMNGGVRRDISSNPFYELRKLMRNLSKNEAAAVVSSI